MHLQKQLRKEGRRNEYERHKLQTLNQRQKMVRSSLLLVYYLFILPAHQGHFKEELTPSLAGNKF